MLRNLADVERPHLPPRRNPSRVRVSVVSPCFNEEQVVEKFYHALKATLSALKDVEHQIVLVDDGSTDGTLDVLNAIALDDPCVQVYSLSRNFGHQVALSAGLDVADGDAVVMMDSDLQHPPALIPDMVERWLNGYDVVSAVREHTQGAGPWKHGSSRMFYRLLNWLSDVHIVEGAADFCLLSRHAHESLQRMPERHRFVRGLIAWMGFRRAFIPYVAAERGGGCSKYTWRKMFALAADAAISFSAAPMRIAVHFGVITAVLGVLYAVYIFSRALMHAEDLVPGWASVMCVVLCLGGVQLTFIGIVGSYLGRVFEQVKGRPLYFFKQSPGRLSPGHLSRPAGELLVSGQEGASR